MLFNSWPRHQLRALGKRSHSVETSASVNDAAEMRSTGSGKSESERNAERLLDFLSKSVAQDQLSLLNESAPLAVPEFIRPQASFDIVAVPERRIAQRRMPALDLDAELPEVAEHSMFGELADTLAREAMALSAEAALEELSSGLALDETIAPALSVTTFDTSRGASLLADHVADLDSWFGFGGVDDQPAPDVLEATTIDPLLRVRHALPAALPPVAPWSRYSGDDDDEPDKRPAKSEETADKAKPAVRSLEPESEPSSGRGSRFKRAMFNRNVLHKPTLMSMPDGSRRERFQNGSEMTKDALGRVVEVLTPYGSTLQVRYGEEGQPKSFVRLGLDGEPHSYGECDKHGVVVRDPEGRVRAAGESIAVDPKGCLSVRRFDGQFWTLDMVRGVHIERRRMTNRDGETHVLTALFAFDGFRMVTRFQQVAPNANEAGDGTDSSIESSGCFRFYGRDGSVVQFDSEDDLIDLKPSRVWQPNSRPVQGDWKRYHQAGTAWESVQEYVTNYLLS